MVLVRYTCTYVQGIPTLPGNKKLSSLHVNIAILTGNKKIVIIAVL